MNVCAKGTTAPAVQLNRLSLSDTRVNPFRSRINCLTLCGTGDWEKPEIYLQYKVMYALSRAFLRGTSRKNKMFWERTGQRGEIRQIGKIFRTSSSKKHGILALGNTVNAFYENEENKGREIETGHAACLQRCKRLSF